ncbi:hypothetical protein I8H84_05590 [Candidatus Saccharibacteria bacterium]|nr:hypothetical protein [Candidatus Saccharibacteria bacterium]MBH1973192.1 hypothetical protein [Candidatus Saccharibacteria bacterium]MBH1990567.1 hypothetical protein [Candidatus Saccharibacteria bacterium]
MTAITINDIERIDINEGPNLAGLLQPWLTLNTLNEGAPRVQEISVRFDEVMYILTDGTKLDKKLTGETLSLQLLGLEVLGGTLKSIKTGDVIVTVAALGMTFKGHYNTHKRKGSFHRRCDTV